MPPRRHAAPEVLALLLREAGALSTLQLVERLGFGKAAVSMACSSLARYELIRRCGRAVDGSFAWEARRRGGSNGKEQE